MHTALLKQKNASRKFYNFDIEIKQYSNCIVVKIEKELTKRLVGLTVRFFKAKKKICFNNNFFCEGANVGIVMALPLSGYISSDYHWKFVFYLFGALTFVWFIFWAILIQNSPADHPRISEVKCHFRSCEQNLYT